MRKGLAPRLATSTSSLSRAWVCGIASVPPPRHQHLRCFHFYILVKLVSILYFICYRYVTVYLYWWTMNSDWPTKCTCKLWLLSLLILLTLSPVLESQLWFQVVGAIPILGGKIKESRESKRAKHFSLLTLFSRSEERSAFLNDKQLDATTILYDGSDVFLWVPTGYSKVHMFPGASFIVRWRACAVLGGNSRCPWFSFSSFISLSF